MVEQKTFREFIEQVGRSRLCTILGVTRSTVHKWTTHEQAPRPATAFHLIMFSQGVLSWEAVYKPFAEHDLKGKSIVSVDPLTGAKITFDFK